MTSLLPVVIKHESWPLAASFTASRGKTHADLIKVELWDGTHFGYGEAVPYARYGETLESVLTQLDKATKLIMRDTRGEDLEQLLPPGSARNALDCALWDLRAKQGHARIWDVMGMPALQPVRTTDSTIFLDTPGAMAATASKIVSNLSNSQPLLKIKLGGFEQDFAMEESRLRAVRNAVPNATLIVDANEGWSADMLRLLIPALTETRIAALEQPLRAQDDNILREITLPCPVFADESVQDRASLPALAGKYQGINIKLDKTGGLTEALALRQIAISNNLQIMVGCTIATSLAIAPALLVAQGAMFADLDGATLLAADRAHGLAFENGFINPPSADLWG